MAAYRAMTLIRQRELAIPRSVAAINRMEAFRHPINEAKRTAEDAAVTASGMKFLSMGQSVFMGVLQCRVLMELNTASLKRTMEYWCAIRLQFDKLTSVQPC